MLGSQLLPVNKLSTREHAQHTALSILLLEIRHWHYIYIYRYISQTLKNGASEECNMKAFILKCNDFLRFNHTEKKTMLLTF